MRTHDRETRVSIAVLAARLTELAVVLGRGESRSALQAVREVGARDLTRAGAAAMMALAHALEQLWDRGWVPADVVAVAPREVSGLLLDAIAHETARYSAGELHPRWRTQLADLAVRDRPEPVFTDDLLGRAVELIAALMVLPHLPHLVPAPGERFADDTAAPGVDRKLLARVRGLLAKAESTPYPDEAEALSAKAQELMARHAFERAVVDADDHRPQGAAATRLWLTAPYQAPKAQLVEAVASANRSRSVFYARLGCVAVIGHETDLEIVEVLSASLHVQSTRAMTRAPSRSRAYRHAFLVGYAHRIQQRLSEAATAADPGDTRLVPVLAHRKHAVDIKFDALFPGIRVRRTTASNPAGWGAGRAAADQADLATPRPRLSS